MQRGHPNALLITRQHLLHIRVYSVPRKMMISAAKRRTISPNRRKDSYLAKNLLLAYYESFPWSFLEIKVRYARAATVVLPVEKLGRHPQFLF